MKKAFKVLGILLGSLLLLGAAAVVAAVMLFDGPRIKSVMEETVANKTGRTLKIDGVPELTVWPRLGVRLPAVSLSQPLRADEFAGIDQAQLSIAVLPLFSGQLVADRVVLTGLRAQLVRLEDGSLNFADLMPAKDDGSAAKPGPDQAKRSDSSQGAAPIRFDVGGLEVSGHDLIWEDRVQALKAEVRDFAVETGRLGPGESGAVQARVQLSVTRGTAKPETLALKTSANYRIGESKIEVLGLQAELAGRVTGVEEMSAAMKVARLEIGLATKELALRDWNVALAGKLPTLKLSAELGGVELSLAGRAGGNDQQRLAIPELSFKAAATNGQGLAADIALAGKLELLLPELQLTLADWKGQVKANDPALLQQAIDLGLAFSSQFDLAALSGNLDASLRLAGSEGSLKTRLASVTPLAAEVALKFGDLDLDAYLLPPPEATGESQPAGRAGAPEKEATIDLSGLQGKQIAAQVELGRLKVRKLIVDQTALAATLSKGVMTVKPLRVRMYQGSVTGALSANSRGNVIASDLRLSGIDLAPLLSDLAKVDLLAGRADIDARLTTQGATVSAMRRAVDGTLSLRIADGAIRGINLAKTFRDTKAKFSSKSSSESTAQSDEQTDFTELTGSFKATDGVFQGDDLSAKSPFLRLGGAGKIDVGNETLDYLLKASVVNTSAGQGGDDLAHLRGLTVPVRLTGPLTAPAWKIEFGAMAGEAAKARLEEKKAEAKAEVKAAVEERKDELRERAREKLKGLLGR